MFVKGYKKEFVADFSNVTMPTANRGLFTTRNGLKKSILTILAAKKDLAKR
jgi:hypothetical protein